MKKKMVMSSLLIVFLFSITKVGMLLDNENLNLKIRIFQVPPWQSIVMSVPTPPGEKGVKGSMRGGNVTASFPNGIVLFETDLPQSNEDIIRFIKEQTRFTFPDFVNILPVADVYIRVDTENLKTSIIGERKYPPRNKHLITDYTLQVLPLSIQNEEAVFKFGFFAKYKVAEGDKKKLLDRTLGVAYSKTLIVGFPTNDNTGRGAVYWLVFSFED